MSSFWNLNRRKQHKLFEIFQINIQFHLLYRHSCIADYHCIRTVEVELSEVQSNFCVATITDVYSFSDISRSHVFKILTPLFKLIAFRFTL